MYNKDIFTLDIPKIFYQTHPVNSVIGQCDACSPVIATRNESLRFNSGFIAYCKNPNLVKQTVNSEYSAVFSALTNTTCVLNKSAMYCWQYFDSSPKTFESIPTAFVKAWGESIISESFQQMITLGLLLPVDCLDPNLTEMSNMLSVWLHITDRCNLECRYCYLPHNNADMSLETGHSAIDATFRSAIAHKYQAIKFKYSGGEPLLRFSLVKELHRYAQTLAQYYNVELDGVILSNGTLLTAEIVNEMKALGLRLMISLDSTHKETQTRIQNTTQGASFNEIDASYDAMRAVEIALKHNLVPDISITVSGINIENLPELLDWILTRDLPFCLNFYRENNLSINYDNLKLKEEAIVNGMLTVYKVIETYLPYRNLLASLVDRANFSTAHLRTCGVGHNYMVFDPYGQVSKCQMQIDRPITTSLAKDPLILIQEDKGGIKNLSVEEKDGCHQCEWKYWCAGGCPLETYRTTGRYDGRSPNCAIYKALYPKVLQLEGKRLLKYYS